MTTPAKTLRKATTQETQLVVDDNGFAYHKLAWFGEKNQIMTTKYTSVIEKTDSGYSDASGNPVNRYETLEGVYYVPLNASNPLDLRTGDYSCSAANRVLVNHGLVKIEAAGRPVHLAVTLPFREYYLPDGKVNEERRAQVSNNFLQVVGSSPSDAPQPQVKGVSVYAECLSAWYDWALDQNGNVNAKLRDQCEIAIVDVGGETTDICAVAYDGKLIIDNSASNTKKIGVLDAIKVINEKVGANLKSAGVDISSYGNTLPRKFIEQIVQTGKGVFNRQEWDFTEIRNDVLKNQAEIIVSFIAATLRNLGRFDHILVIGGGAIVYQEFLAERLPGAEFSDEFANARGALKYLKYIDTPKD